MPCSFAAEDMSGRCRGNTSPQKNNPVRFNVCDKRPWYSRIKIVAIAANKKAIKIVCNTNQGPAIAPTAAESFTSPAPSTPNAKGANRRAPPRRSPPIPPRKPCRPCMAAATVSPATMAGTVTILYTLPRCTSVNTDTANVAPRSIVVKKAAGTANEKTDFSSTRLLRKSRRSTLP